MSEVKVRCDRDTLLLSVARSRKRAALFFLAFVNQFSLSTFIQFLNFVYKPSADNSPVGDGNRLVDVYYAVFKNGNHWNWFCFHCHFLVDFP